MGTMDSTKMNVSEAVLDFRVAPEPQTSRLVRHSVTEFARAHGVCEDDLAHFLIALGEAIANAVEHGHPETPVEIEVRVGGDRIIATVQDGGAGFSADAIADAEFPGIDAERGRGLPIMRSCCDIFAVKTEAGRGTAVVLGRYLRDHTEVA